MSVDSKPVTSESAALPRLTVRGNRIVLPTGEPVLLRGLSVADPDILEAQGHWNRKLFEGLKEMGAQIVRLPIHPAAWRGRTPERYLVLLDQAIAWSTELGMYVIIDWHSIGNLEAGLFQQPVYYTTVEETNAFWRLMAQRYGKHPTVAFFELFNEPTTHFGKLGRASWATWRSLNEQWIELIRAYDAEAIPLVAGFDWAYLLSPILEEPIRAPGIAYVTHPYPNKRSRPWEPKWEENFAFAAGKHPVIATEIGFEMAEGESITDDHYANRITRFLESRNIGWLGWVYDPAWHPQLLKSWETFELTGPGAFFKEALHRPPAAPVEQETRKPGDV